MKIRRATTEDLPRIMPLIMAFHKETLEPFGMGFDIPSVEAIVKIFSEQHIGLVVEIEDPSRLGQYQIVGVIGGAIAPSFTDFSQRIFNEAIWFVLPEYRGGSAGVKLLKLVEEYCKNIGVQKIVMIGMFNEDRDRLASFYEKMGYKAIEIHYIKDLKNAGN